MRELRRSESLLTWRAFVGSGVFVGLVIGLQTTLGAQRAKVEPESATGRSAKGLVFAREQMVVAANPYASKAGLRILRAGGSAVDAAIATQLVLNLVEPQSSGIGGGAFLVRYDGASGAVATLDGRERAPKSAMPDRFMRQGKPMNFTTAVQSGLSVGVPGLVAMMELAHQKWGRLPWRDVLAPAIKLSDDGFVVSKRLHGLLAWAGATRFSKKARAYFFDSSGQARPVGYVLRNPAFAKTLRSIAEKGSRAFYEGPVALEIVDAVQAVPNARGDMTLADLRNYKAVERAAVCVPYRDKKVCGMGPPSSGAHTVGQSLMMLENFDLGKVLPPSARAIHLISEAEKLAFADRDQYLADSDFVGVPDGLLAPSYIKARSRLIDPSRATGRANPGTPEQVKGTIWGRDATIERGGTSHFSIVDSNGNAVSMTSSIEGAFGSGLWAAGFLLNNELTDFSFTPVDKSGQPIANRVEGEKRPRSSMSPTIILDQQGRFFAVLGSPGGSRIIPYVVKGIVALVDWNMDALSSAALANFGNRNNGLELELGGGAVWDGLKLKAFGHSIKSDTMTSGLHIIVGREGRLEGGADPRREGLAVGD